MKIENKTTGIASQDKPDENLDYRDIILVTVNSPVKQGMDMLEVAKRVSLIEALVKADGFIELDEEQTVLMREIWANHRWQAAHPDVLAVDEAIKRK